MSPAGSSPSSSSASSSISNPAPSQVNANQTNGSVTSTWWESLSAVRSRIQSLSLLLPLPPSLLDTDRPAHSLLSSPAAFSALSDRLSLPLSGAGDDPLCHWLYDAFLSSDPDLRLLVLSLLPLLTHLYLSRLLSPHPPSLAGFEAVLLAVYGTEAHARNGKPVLVTIPDLQLPSLYHTPKRTGAGGGNIISIQQQGQGQGQGQGQIGVLSPPLEPHRSVKSTKRASIIGVAFDCYYKKISLIPSQSKIDFCRFVAVWAGQNCPCRYEFDEPTSPTPSPKATSPDSEVECVIDGIGRIGVNEVEKGVRVPMPWEMLQPVIRVLGHCLLAEMNGEEVREKAGVAVRCVYARAMHELMPQAILATKSLIQLDKGMRGRVEVGGGVGSNPTTPSKPKKPEVFLASK